MINKKLGIVVLNWNAPSDTLKCIDSLYKNIHFDFSVVVVDNGSTDNSVAALENNDLFELIRNNENLGYAGGNNIGLKYFFDTDFDLCLVLNNDTCFVDDRIICHLCSDIEEIERIGIVGLGVLEQNSSTLYNTNKKKYDFFSLLFRFAGINESGRKNEYLQYVDRVSGAAIIITKECYEAIGLFDEQYFLYCEEIDYCFRVKCHGMKVLMEVAPHYSVIHSRDLLKARPYVIYYQFRNMYLFCVKNFHGLGLVFAKILYLISVINFIFSQRKAMFSKNIYKNFLSGIKDGFKGVVGILPS